MQLGFTAEQTQNAFSPNRSAWVFKLDEVKKDAAAYYTENGITLPDILREGDTV